MNHDEKLSYFFEDLKRLGIKRRYASPLSYWVMWKAGIRLTPPHFSSFVTIFIHFFAVWVILYGTMSWFLIWRAKDILISNFLLMILFTASAFGILMAFYYRRQAKRMNLPTWSQYPNA